MSRKGWITMGMVIGGSIGGYVPMLWGDNSLFSMTSIIFTFFGSIAGILAGFRLASFLE